MTQAERKLLRRIVADAIETQDGLRDAWSEAKSDPQYQVHVDLLTKYRAFQAKHCGVPADPFRNSKLVSIYEIAMTADQAPPKGDTP